MSTTTEPTSRTDHEFHRKVAAECFNRTWDYLEKKNRGPDDDQMMLNLAARVQVPLEPHRKTLNLHNWRLTDLPSLRNAKPARPCPQLRKDSPRISQKTISRGFSYQPTKACHKPMPRQRNTPMSKQFINKARGRSLAVSLDPEDRKICSDQIDETDRMIPK
jgi:hypothetical protein